MRKFLFAALAVTLGFTCCREDGGSENRGEISAEDMTLTASISTPRTRIALNPEVYDPNAHAEVDEAVWKAEDVLRLYELKYTSQVSPYQLYDGYILADTTAFDLGIVSGAGTRRGIFAKRGLELDTTAIYVALHAGDIRKTTWNQPVGQNRGIYIDTEETAKEVTLSESLLTADNRAWSENGLCFYGILRFNGSEPLPIEFKPLSTIFEFNISTAADVPEFEMSKLEIKVQPGIASANLVACKQSFVFHSDYSLFVTAATAQPGPAITFPPGHMVGSTAPLRFRYPLTFLHSGYHEGIVSRDVKITITSTTGKTWAVVKPKEYEAGVTSLFAAGHTYIVHLVVDCDLN